MCNKLTSVILLLACMQLYTHAGAQLTAEQKDSVVFLASDDCENMNSFIARLPDQISQKEAAELALTQIGKKCSTNEIGELYRSLGWDRISVGEMEKARMDFDSAIRYFSHAGDTLMEARSVIGVAEVYGRTGQPDTSILLFRKALAMVSRISNLKYQADIQGRMGATMIRAERFLESVDYFKRALDISIQAKDTTEICQNYTDMGVVYNLLGDREQCLVYYEKALKLAQKAGVLNTELNILVNLTGYEIEGGSQERMLRYSKEAITLADRMQHVEAKAKVYNNLGYYYFYKKDYPNAVKNLQTAISLKKQVNSPVLVSSMLLLGDCFLAQDMLDKAERIANEAVVIGENMSDINALRRAHYLLAEVSYKNEEFQEAFDQLKRSYFYKDSIAAMRKTENTRKLMAQYQFDLQNKEIKLLENEKLLKEVQLKLNKEESRRVKGIAIAAGVMSLVVLVGLFLFFRYRQKTQREILSRKSAEERRESVMKAQESERKKLARELHDGVASSLAATRIHLGNLQLKFEDKDLLEVENELGKVLNDIRNISHVLSPTVLYQSGLEDFLNSWTQQLNKNTKEAISIDMFSETGFEKLPDELQLNIFRIIQELVNNALKYAKASKILISLSVIEDEITLLVEDDGVGFNPELVKRGIGLQNIKDRLLILSGEMTLDSIPGRGTTVVINMHT